MAFDKNNTPGWMKVVIVAFAVILVVSMCLPFFSSCSFNSGNASQQAEESDQQADSTTNTTTVAAVKQQYSGVISNLEKKLADNPDNTTAMASLGNNYKDMANACVRLLTTPATKARSRRPSPRRPITTVSTWIRRLPRP